MPLEEPAAARRTIMPLDGPAATPRQAQQAYAGVATAANASRPPDESAVPRQALQACASAACAANASRRPTGRQTSPDECPTTPRQAEQAYAGVATTATDASPSPNSAVRSSAPAAASAWTSLWWTAGARCGPRASSALAMFHGAIVPLPSGARLRCHSATMELTNADAATSPLDSIAAKSMPTSGHDT